MRSRPRLADDIRRSIRQMKRAGHTRADIAKRLMIDECSVKNVMKEYRQSYKRYRNSRYHINLPEPVVCRNCRNLINVLPCQTCEQKKVI